MTAQTCAGHLTRAGYAALVCSGIVAAAHPLILLLLFVVGGTFFLSRRLQKPV